MNDIELNTLAQIEQFLSSSTQLTFEATSRAESYLWVTNTLKKFAYCGMCKKDKGLIRDYLQRMTGYSRSQITRLIAIERYFVCKNQLQYLEKPLKF